MDTTGELVEIYLIEGSTFEVYGYFEPEDHPDSDGPESADYYDYYDVFQNGVCINLGDPIFEMPSEGDVRLLAHAPNLSAE
jgi:hypothetical protein